MIKNKHIAILVTLMFALTMFSPAAYALNFSDISGHWAEDQIKSMTDEGIINGYPQGTFQPDGKITRAEFASLLVTAFGLTKGEGKSFTDTVDHWAKDAIAAANAAGIVNGYSDTIFGPDDPITREQMAVMIVKAARLTDAAHAKTFADSSSISDWAKEAVDIATSNQLISGYPDNTFQPQGNATRAEATAVLSGVLKKSTTPAKPAEKVEEEQEDTVTEKPVVSTNRGGGSSSSSSSSKTKISAVSITGEGGATEITTDGGTLQMVAEVEPDNASNKNVTWSVDDEDLARISSSGLLTAEADGKVEVTATAKDGSGKSGSITITISNQIPVFVSHIRNFPNNKEKLGIKGTSVTSNNPDIATAEIIGTLNQEIKITSVGIGTAMLTVKSSSVTATIEVFVGADGRISIGTITKGEPVVTKVSISENPTKISYTIGEKLDLSGLRITLSKNDGSGDFVDFDEFTSRGMTSNPSHDDLLSTAGTVTITVTHAETGLTETFDVTVSDTTVADAEKLTIESVKPGSGAGTTIINIFERIPSGYKRVYKIGPSEVTGLKVTDKVTDGKDYHEFNITINANQYITIYEINGETKEVAKYVSRQIVDSEIMESVIIPVDNIKLPISRIYLAVGEKFYLTVTFTPYTPTNKNVTWSSENPSIATVNENGTVTAVGIGKTIITVTSEDGGHKATSNVTVGTKITEAHFTGFTLPVKDAVVNFNFDSLSEDVNYRADDVFWSYIKEGEQNSTSLEEGDTFQAGTEYELSISIRPKEGYILAHHEDFTATINGKDADKLLYYDGSMIIYTEYTVEP